MEGSTSVSALAQTRGVATIQSSVCHQIVAVQVPELSFQLLDVYVYF